MGSNCTTHDARAAGLAAPRSQDKRYVLVGFRSPQGLPCRQRTCWGISCTRHCRRASSACQPSQNLPASAGVPSLPTSARGCCPTFGAACAVTKHRSPISAAPLKTAIFCWRESAPNATVKSAQNSHLVNVPKFWVSIRPGTALNDGNAPDVATVEKRPYSDPKRKAQEPAYRVEVEK